ncbi:hypothetical protein HD554DRAFT_522912 [Boletus coccyginus]|nr:hypothetical protein HD554DRAFT_522912 [Boletus coccyginus]
MSVSSCHDARHLSGIALDDWPSVIWRCSRSWKRSEYAFREASDPVYIPATRDLPTPRGRKTSSVVKLITYHSHRVLPTSEARCGLWPTASNRTDAKNGEEAARPTRCRTIICTATPGTAPLSCLLYFPALALPSTNLDPHPRRTEGRTSLMGHPGAVPAHDTPAAHTGTPTIEWMSLSKRKKCSIRVHARCAYISFDKEKRLPTANRHQEHVSATFY